MIILFLKINITTPDDCLYLFHQNSSLVRKVENDIIGLVIKYDEELFPDDRKAFIRNWITQEETITMAFLDQDAAANDTTKIKGKN